MGIHCQRFPIDQCSKESPFFLMFGRDHVLFLNTILGPKLRYLGTHLNTLSLEALKDMFEIAAANLKIAREKGGPENKHLPTKLQPGDTVLIQNYSKGPFDPKYTGDYRVVAIKGNQVIIRPSVDTLSNYLGMTLLVENPSSD